MKFHYFQLNLTQKKTWKNWKFSEIKLIENSMHSDVGKKFTFHMNSQKTRYIYLNFEVMFTLYFHGILLCIPDLIYFLIFR